MQTGLDLVPSLPRLSSHLVDLRALRSHLGMFVPAPAGIGMSLTEEERVPVHMEDREVVADMTQVIACGVMYKRPVVLYKL